MAGLELLCRIATPFKKSGEVDEEALRKFLPRFVKSKIGIYLCSAAGGESRALTWDEIGRIYQIGLEECKGKIAVHANPPEQYPARLRREYIVQAAKAGVDVVMINIYTGRRLNDAEFMLYFKEVLAGIRHPISFAVNARPGSYTPKAEVMAELCNKHRQIVAFNLSNGADSYFVRFKDGLKREMPIYVHCSGSLNKLAMGAQGVFGTEANIIPKTQKAYVDAVASKNFAAIGRHYEQIIRYTSFMSQWAPANPRAIKLAFRLLKLPGWEGGVRAPHHMLPEKEYQRFVAGILKLSIPEITEQACAAGVRA